VCLCLSKTGCKGKEGTNGAVLTSASAGGAWWDFRPPPAVRRYSSAAISQGSDPSAERTILMRNGRQLLTSLTSIMRMW